MEIITVKQQIKNKKFDSFYIFTGDEIEVQRIYIKKIVEQSGTKVSRPDTVSEIVSRLSGKSMFNQPTCYVIIDDNDFIKNESAWDKVEDMLRDNILILQLSSVDKRSKFYKRYKDKIVSFERLSDDLLIKYIQREIPLSKCNSERLISICESDYSRILLETDKIKRVGNDVNESFEQLLKDGTIYRPAKDVVFDWVDAIMVNDVNKAFELYQDCERRNVSPLAMLSLLYTAVKQTLQVKDCIRENVDIAKNTGLSSYQINIAKSRVQYNSIGDLVYMLRMIRETEVGIKTGKVDSETAIPQLMVKIL